MARGPVELWLAELLQQQQISLHSVIKSAYMQISDSGFQLLNFLYQFPSQVGDLSVFHTTHGFETWWVSSHCALFSMSGSDERMTFSVK